MKRLRVMISSTIDDLKEERDAVDRAIRHFRFQRFRSERLGSLARSAWDVCDEMARDCDLYILLVGRRYGWVVPDRGLSVTELEYNVARRADPSKILVYAQDLPPGTREPQAEIFLKRVTDFTSGYFRAAPFKSPDALADRVKSDLATWVSERIMKRHISPATAFGLPSGGEVRTMVQNLTLMVLITALMLEVGSKLNLGWRVPSAVETGQSAAEYGGILWRGVFSGVSWSVCAFLCATTFWVAVLVSVALLQPTARRVVVRYLPALLITLTLALIPFGYGVFGLVRSTPVVMASLVVALYLSGAVGRELQRMTIENQRWDSEHRAIEALVANVLLSTTIPNGFLLGFLVYIGSDLALLGGQTALGELYRASRVLFNLSLMVAVVASSAIGIAATYAGIRALQASIGWTFIHDAITATGTSPTARD